MPPVGPPVIVPMGRAIQNKGIELDARFKVNISTNEDAHVRTECLLLY